MECSNCGFKINKDDVICPICENVITNNLKENECFLSKPKTNKYIIMFLTYLFSASVAMVFLIFCKDYREVVHGGALFRPFIFFVIICLHNMTLAEQPFFNSDFVFTKKIKNRKVLKEHRKNSFVYYFVLMCFFMLFWNLVFGRLILFDLKAYNGGALTQEVIQKKYMVYTTFYYLTTIFCYAPYLIYHYFTLNFEYDDTKKYFKTFIIINWILLSVIFLIFKW